MLQHRRVAAVVVVWLARCQPLLAWLVLLLVERAALACTGLVSERDQQDMSCSKERERMMSER